MSDTAIAAPARKEKGTTSSGFGGLEDPLLAAESASAGASRLADPLLGAVAGLPGAGAPGSGAPGPVAGAGVITATTLFLRDAPGDGAKIGGFPKGTPVVATATVVLPDRSELATWYEVTVSRKSGFMAADFIRLAPGVAAPPSRRPPEPSPETKTEGSAPAPAPAVVGGDLKPPATGGDPKQDETGDASASRKGLDLSDPKSPIGQLWKKGEFNQGNAKNLIGRSVTAMLQRKPVIDKIRANGVYAKDQKKRLDAKPDAEFMAQKIGGKSFWAWFANYNCVVFTQFLDYRATELRTLEKGYDSGAAMAGDLLNLLTDHWEAGIVKGSIQSKVDFANDKIGTFAQGGVANGDPNGGLKSKVVPTVKVFGRDPKTVAAEIRQFDGKNGHIRVGYGGSGYHSYLGLVDGDVLKSFDQNQVGVRGDVDISKVPNTKGTKASAYFWHGIGGATDKQGRPQQASWVSFKNV